MTSLLHGVSELAREHVTETGGVGANTGAPDAAGDALRRLAQHGYDLATGVPCSLLAGFFAHLESPEKSAELGISYIASPREDSAVGLAVGAQLAGRRPIVLMQNSGFGYSLNVFTSLTMIYEVNPFLIMSWRGFDGTDAVEHDIIGRELPALLEVLHIDSFIIDPAAAETAVDAAVARHDGGLNPIALLVTEAL